MNGEKVLFEFKCKPSQSVKIIVNGGGFMNEVWLIGCFSNPGTDGTVEIVKQKVTW